MQMSNDAFYYLYYNEEPLDEDNLEEALEILSTFPNGFYIDESWKAVEDSDLIEATLIPYIEDKVDYDEFENITNTAQLQIKWIDSNTIKAWYYNTKTGARKACGNLKVFINKHGHKCFHTGDQEKQFMPGKMSLYFLNRFKKR